MKHNIRDEMSAKSLRSQLREDYLTCSICFNGFTRPKALPCLHTYCEGCLRDYIVSRGYESADSFPCPVCRANTTMPETGVRGFPNNHLMSSLSDTVANSEEFRPTPKPRRSIGQTQVQPESDEKSTPPYNAVSVVDANPEITSSKICCNDTDTPTGWMPAPHCTPSAPFLVCDNDAESDNSQHNAGVASVSASYPSNVPISSDDLADTLSQISKNNFSTGFFNVPAQGPSHEIGKNTFSFDQPTVSGKNPTYLPESNSNVPVYPQLAGNMTTGGAPPTQAPPIGWNVNNLGDLSLSKSFNIHNTVGSKINHGPPGIAQSLYPAMPTQSVRSNFACTENLVLSFGKQGSSIRDFLKPVGFTVSKECNYVISDSGGGQNRIFIFNSAGQLITAFNCGGKVKDITMTKENEILAAVHKNVSAIRHFTMAGMCKGEYGKFFTFEEPCGIGQLTTGGVALSGTQNHCIYILTDQMKLATKFGRKGNGDGYFQHPAFITVDSKNHIIVTDKINNCVQVFNSEGKFRHRFGSSGKNHGQFEAPLGICVDDNDNIIIADSGNCRVEVFSSRGHWLSSVVSNTFELGDKVKPVNVAFTPTGKVAVLLRGPYFAEVRVYTSQHKHLVHKEGLVSTIFNTTSALLFSE